MKERKVVCSDCGEYYDFNMNKGICPNCETPFVEEEPIPESDKAKPKKK